MAYTVKELREGFDNQPEDMKVLVEVVDSNGEVAVYEVEDAGGYDGEYGAYMIRVNERADVPDEVEANS